MKTYLKVSLVEKLFKKYKKFVSIPTGWSYN